MKQNYLKLFFRLEPLSLQVTLEVGILWDLQEVERLLVSPLEALSGMYV